VICSDLLLSDGVAANAHVNCLGDRVDIDSCLRGARYCDVSSTAENRFYLQYRATHLDSVEQFTGPWHGDGGQHAQNAERDSDLDYRERVSHPTLLPPA